jgi:uncharacterized membrane protein YeaQ/YmgE (transglycosylase-associated protein family)
MLGLSLGSLISWIIFGLIAGALAKLIMPGNDPGGFIITIILGIAGAIVGGFIANQFNIGGSAAAGDAGIGSAGFITQLIFAVIGAIILLALYRLIAGRRA